MSKTKIAIILSLLIIPVFLLFLGNIMSQVDEPKFKLIQKIGNIEIREYENILIAQVETTGERSVAINSGFRILADYIFGNNDLKIKIPMTAPVLQQSIEEKKKRWQISFVMPAEYKINTLPQPHTHINIKEFSKKKYAIIRFSGFSTDSNLSKHVLQLNLFIEKNNLKTVNQPIFAFYNPPWTLPFLKRNEIMLEIE